MLRIITLALMLIVAGVAYSQPPTPRPVKTTEPIKQAAPDPNTNTASDQTGTKYKPFVVDIVAAPNAKQRADDERQDRNKASAIEDGIRRYTFWLVLATCLLGIIAIWQGYLISQQIKLGREEFVSINRPRIRVRNIVVSNFSKDVNNGTVTLKNGEPVRGQFYIANVGGTDAKIKGVGCWIEHFFGGLPMKRPYEGKNPNRIGNVVLAPGQSIPIPFGDGNPLEANEARDIQQGAYNRILYVMGWVEYLDSTDILRRTAFCRSFIIQKGRFFVVDDPDYEYEE